MNWKDKLPACFGCDDHIFASHPMDEGRGRQMITDAFASGASINDLLEAVTEYLTSKGCPDIHIEQQINALKNLRFLA